MPIGYRNSSLCDSILYLAVNVAALTSRQDLRNVSTLLISCMLASKEQPQQCSCKGALWAFFFRVTILNMQMGWRFHGYPLIRLCNYLFVFRFIQGENETSPTWTDIRAVCNLHSEIVHLQYSFNISHSHWSSLDTCINSFILPNIN